MTRLVFKIATEYAVICDKCGEGASSYQDTLKEAIADFRDCGWSFGKRAICPICNGTGDTLWGKRNDKRIEAMSTLR